MLPNGTMIIDTPGMRELGMWDCEEGLDKTFKDVEQFWVLVNFQTVHIQMSQVAEY